MSLLMYFHHDECYLDPSYFQKVNCDRLQQQQKYVSYWYNQPLC